MTSAREQILAKMLPQGVPSLWCPPLTHYTADGAIDHARIRAHLRFMSPWVKGLLVPGTTGDGWELPPDEVDQVVGLMLDCVPGLGMRLLWGALHPDAAVERTMIESGIAALKKSSGCERVLDALCRSSVCGFAVCPPRGANVSQAEMQAALSGILDLGVPLALYQLPQVTQNEMSPVLVAQLAAQYPHFMLLKDTSGNDRVASAGLDLGGVRLVRGMEGDYARWLKVGAGCYDGFLLSSANSFGQQLWRMRELLQRGHQQEAQSLSDRLTGLIDALFRIVDAVPIGNKFTNANKLADHYHAHGPRAVRVPPPRLHGGEGLTREMVQAAGAALEQYALMPAKGYLE